MGNQHARGVWYASPYIWQADKWAVYSPMGVCVSLHDSKKEAIAEALRLASTRANCAHPECQPFAECSRALPPDQNSGRGRNVAGAEHQKDVWELTHGAVGYRLAKGFSFWRS